jgi:hypothetical protein
MAVKVAPAPGSVIEETKRTRVIPPNSPDNEGDKPWRVLDKWDYIASLAPEAWTRENLVVYLYRYDDKGNPWGIGKFTGTLDEFKVLEMFGGGRFNLKMKRGPQLIINDDFQLEGPPKIPGVNGAPAPGTTAPNGDVLLTALNALIEELRAARGGTVAQDAIRNAMSLQGQVFGAGVEAVKHTLGAGAPAAAPTRDPLIEKLLEASITRLINPPATNALKETIEMIAALKGSGLMGGGDSKAGIALELVRQVPQVATTLVQGIQAWHMAEEARARQVAMMRGASPPINMPATPAPTPSNVVEMPSPGTKPEAAAPAPAPQADAIAAAESLQKPVQPMPLETLEQMICNIVADGNLTVEQAANEACVLIERSSPGQTELMANQGEEWIWNLFHQRPILQQVADHPRLREFVRLFVAIVKAAPVMQTINPNAPPA